MEPNRTMNIPLVSFACTILGISVSVFLNNLLSLMQTFSCIFGYRIGIILIESFFAYFMGFLVIVNPNGNLTNPIKREISNLLLTASIVTLLLIIGIVGFSFKYLNILSFTAIVLALIHSTLNAETSYLMNGKRIPLSILMCCSFFVLSLFVTNFGYSSTILLNDFEAIEVNGDPLNPNEKYIDIYTTLFQEKGISMDIKAEMIPMGDCYIEKNTEFIKIVNILENNDKSILRWRVCFPPENRTYTLYLFIWNSFEDKQYKIGVTKENNEWNCKSSDDVSFQEYLRVFYYTRARRIYELFEVLFRNIENH
jgi:hypothetical protein